MTPHYAAPLWLPGGNVQTIWAARRSRRFLHDAPVFERQRWISPDQDFVDVDFLKAASPTATAHEVAASATEQPGETTTTEMVKKGTTQPLLVVFHGLEGSSQSHYAQAFADVARQRGWACAVPHFRGCSGELNWAPRAYHSGDFAEIDWLLRRLKAQHGGPVVAVGVSLGGNALMRWAAELGSAAQSVVGAVASVCSPLDLAACGWAIGRGLNRQIYTRMFLQTMVPKALKKLEQHPGLYSRQALLAVRDLHAFDNLVTAPLHGFKNTEDYWARASAKPHLDRIAVPALVLNALNDPFIPAWSVAQPKDVSACVTLWQPQQGGHVGFPAAPRNFPPSSHVLAMPLAVVDFLARQANVESGGAGVTDIALRMQ